MNPFLLLFLLIGSMGMSFLCSGMEVGVFSLNRLKIRQLKKQGNRRAQKLNVLLEKPEPFLWTILVSNTVANVILVGLIVYVWKRYGPENAALFWICFFVVIFFVLFVMCDLLPKMMFRMFPTRLCLLSIQSFRFLSYPITPLVSLVSWLSHEIQRWSGGKAYTGNMFGNRDELRLFMQQSSPALSSDERTMINRVLDLQNRTLRHIMIPLEKAVVVQADTVMKEAMALCEDKKITRMPVIKVENGKKRYMGILSLRSVLYRDDFNAHLKAENYMRPALFLDEDTRLEVALARFQRTGERLAIVLDKNRQEIGLASLQDILRSVFGEVHL